jgi:hypothetical protein
MIRPGPESRPRAVTGPAAQGIATSPVDRRFQPPHSGRGRRCRHASISRRKHPADLHRTCACLRDFMSPLFFSESSPDIPSPGAGATPVFIHGIPITGSVSLHISTLSYRRVPAPCAIRCRKAGSRGAKPTEEGTIASAHECAGDKNFMRRLLSLSCRAGRK